MHDPSSFVGQTGNGEAPSHVAEAWRPSGSRVKSPGIRAPRRRAPMCAPRPSHMMWRVFDSGGCSVRPQGRPFVRERIELARDDQGRRQAPTGRVRGAERPSKTRRRRRHPVGLAADPDRHVRVRSVGGRRGAYAAALSAAGVETRHIMCEGLAHTSVPAVGVLVSGDFARDEMGAAPGNRVSVSV